ncbi:acetamidase/formamidase family protein [Deinococcus sp. Leaf326]|uniref:acetamidase/formamidase family protein n=1 Tax=Deinococcus sp. Leaf326 TaxID=1736338 RepID=UPI0006F42892|nr:acetamidase/formamidase family protein [Deinococcus sp. Leaf326]KQR36009.1 formamidase [Deinococcus sp. Leaf326]
MPEHHLKATGAVHTVWDAALPPALHIAPGDTVTFGTLDASYGHVARQVAAGELSAPSDLQGLITAGIYSPGPLTGGQRGHPLTGPVYVEGAQPGDTLVVELLEVRTGDWGWTGCRPGGIGLLDDEVPDAHTHFWDLRAGSHTDFLAPGFRARLPLAPFPGVIGVAPAAWGPHPTAPPRHVGGNMDVRQLVAGSTLYLPVEVPGALLSVGDVHAAQGDGEVSGTGIETDGTVTVRLGLRWGRTLAMPELRTPPEPTPLWAAGAYVTTGHAPELLEAARHALRGMLAHLGEDYGLSFTDAYILASACVDLRISQIVDAPHYTVSALLPQSLFTR